MEGQDHGYLVQIQFDRSFWNKLRSKTEVQLYFEIRICKIIFVQSQLELKREQLHQELALEMMSKLTCIKRNFTASSGFINDTNAPLLLLHTTSPKPRSSSMFWMDVER